MSRAKEGTKAGLAQRLYEWAHTAFPHTVDCRPIDAAPLLTAAGFEVKVVQGELRTQPHTHTHAPIHPHILDGRDH
jgi:hypothetical protein